ncbi:hypothetical protein CEXT_151791 [Caerostris extrusa]|uniref:Uncharacterized protein n=1 Tax=Caerostris extrusa TaxID=172846 RepID=A0AAV4UTN3_CAEEX|nr:hypothetical protein CEXT_151791 [Caerostris extrusa]
MNVFIFLKPVRKTIRLFTLLPALAYKSLFRSDLNVDLSRNFKRLVWLFVHYQWRLSNIIYVMVFVLLFYVQEMPLSLQVPRFTIFLVGWNLAPKKRTSASVEPWQPFFMGHPATEVPPIRKRHTESRLSHIDTVPEMKSYYDGGWKAAHDKDMNIVGQTFCAIFKICNKS